MQLPEDDEFFLKEKGFEYDLFTEGNQGILIIKDYPVRSETYDHSQTNLLLRIPTGYNMSSLDMFWVDPPLKFKDGNYPPAANYFEQIRDRQWQRFSRHLPPNTWKAGIDGLAMFLTFVQRELHKG